MGNQGSTRGSGHPETVADLGENGLSGAMDRLKGGWASQAKKGAGQRPPSTRKGL